MPSKKPTIMLADSDEQYLAPLELMFLEAFGDDIQLELITDQAFFIEHFAKQQHTDVLVASEDFRKSGVNLKKHNIPVNIALTEQIDDSGAGDTGIARIYKYSSAKEVYNQILAVSSGIVGPVLAKSKKSLTVLVYSPSGGTGKTTLSLGICACLAKNMKRVLYINAEPVNTFQCRLQDRAAIPIADCAELQAEGKALLDKIIPLIRTEEFDYLPPFQAALSSLSLPPDIFEKIITAVQRAAMYDVIVVDTDSVFDIGKSSLIMQADRVVLVYEPSKAALFSLNTMLSNMSCGDNDKFFLVCNKYSEDKCDALVDVAGELGRVAGEHVQAIDNADQLSMADLAGIADLRKISFLVL